MSNATKEQMKEEAIARMTLLHLHANAIHDFKTENLVNYSQFGVLFWLTEEQQKRVEEFEKQSGNLVYHVIETIMSNSAGCLHSSMSRRIWMNGSGITKSLRQENLLRM